MTAPLPSEHRGGAFLFPKGRNRKEGAKSRICPDKQRSIIKMMPLDGEKAEKAEKAGKAENIMPDP